MEFTIDDEDYTLANLLQDELLRHKDIKFAGYIIEHPATRRFKMKIEAKECAKEDVKLIFNNVIKNLIEKLKKLKN
jgi:DNA-directed RNA polymerase subunit L